VLKPALAAMGGALIAVSHQTTGLADFQAKYFSGEVYLDSAKGFYAALGGHLGDANMLAMEEVKARGKAAFKQLRAADPSYKLSMDGDGLALGGSLVVAPSGKVEFVHAEQSFGDVAAPEVLLAACKAAARPSRL
jgi:hypothetical protein